MSDAQTTPGYAIGVLDDVAIGPDILRYIEGLEDTFRLFGGEWVVPGATPMVIDGTIGVAIVIIGFPTFEDAQTWYDAAAYQQFSNPQTTHSRSTITLIEGAPPGFQTAESAAQRRVTFSP